MSQDKPEGKVFFMFLPRRYCDEKLPGRKVRSWEKEQLETGLNELRGVKEIHVVGDCHDIFSSLRQLFNIETTKGYCCDTLFLRENDICYAWIFDGSDSNARPILVKLERESAK